MIANQSNLTPRERLDAMVETLRRPMGAARVPSDLGVSTQDRDAIEAVALSLLEKCDALEARIAEAEKPCEWMPMPPFPKEPQ